MNVPFSNVSSIFRRFDEILQYKFQEVYFLPYTCIHCQFKTILSRLMMHEMQIHMHVRYYVCVADC